MQPTVAESRRLVIVEDEAFVAFDLERHLSRAGYDVRGVAADAETALSLVEREHPDLVLMDIHLRGAMDGVSLAATLRDRFDVPVVYLTAHGDDSTLARAHRTAPLGYLLKPYKKPDVQNTVDVALARGRAEKELRRREEALSTTLDCMGEAVFTTDVAGDVTYVNPAGAQLVGRAREALVSHPLAEVVSLHSAAGEPLEDPVRSARAQGRVRLEGAVRHPDSARFVSGTAAALRHGAAELGVVLALQDLTELLAARRQLEFAERLGALGTLAAEVAHEVNNPLAVVSSNVDFALAHAEQGGDVHEALTDARAASQRVARIIGDLQVFSKPQGERLQSVDPRAALLSALRFTRSHWRHVACAVLRPGSVPSALVASTRLSQVVVNLVINAVHAMKGLEGPHRIELGCTTDARGWAVLEICDTGSGVPAELRERIFEPFFTTKPAGSGTGLGLAVSRNIIASFGGELSVAPRAGDRGTCFFIALPPTARVDGPRRRLRSAWVGPRTAATPDDALVFAGDEPALRVELAAWDPRVVFLAVPEAQVPALRACIPELEARAVRVGAEGRPVGSLSVDGPLDAQALEPFLELDE